MSHSFGEKDPAITRDHGHSIILHTTTTTPALAPTTTAPTLATTTTAAAITLVTTTSTVPALDTNPKPVVHVTSGSPLASTSTAGASTSIAKIKDATSSIAISMVTTADPIMTTHTAVVSTPINTLSVHITSSSVPSVTLTTASSSIESASASVTQVGQSVSDINIVAIVGGTVGGLLGVVALLFILRFLLNRRRKHNSGAALNASDFRRSATPMEDPPAYDEIAGFDSGIPTTERRLAPAPTFGNQYSVSESALVPSERRTAKHEMYNSTRWDLPPQP